MIHHEFHDAVAMAFLIFFSLQNKIRSIKIMIGRNDNQACGRKIPSDSITVNSFIWPGKFQNSLEIAKRPKVTPTFRQSAIQDLNDGRKKKIRFHFPKQPKRPVL